jgi:hypothetical protein
MKNILENNRLIAEFMGKKFMVLPDTDEQCFELENSWDIIHSDDFIVDNAIFSYHSNWNKLIEVIEKIEALDEKSFETTSHFNGFINKRLYNTAFINSKNYEVISSGNLMESRIESVYTAILAFIKYYNNQN